MNLPVRHGRSNFSGANHSRAELFTVGRNVAHGDDPYNGWVRLGHNNVPIQRIFLDNAQLVAEIDAPPPLPGKTVPETESFNHSKHSAALAVELKTDYLLHYRCVDRAAHLPGHAMSVWQQLHELYTDGQIDGIVADCDTAIAAIPGGCVSI